MSRVAVDVSAEVIANIPLSSEYHVLHLAAPAIAAAVVPGQFVMVRLSAGRDPLLRRPFSVFQVLRDAGGTPIGISLFSKRIGPATRLLYDARPGMHVDCLGPLGTSWGHPAGEPKRPAFLVAGGVGLAAFALFAADLAARRVTTTLFYGARTGSELFALDVFRATGARLILTTEDGTIGERGRVIAPLARDLAAAASPAPIVYACGPEGMMKAAAATAAAAAAPCFVSMERVMGCGLGGCYSCVVPVRTETGGFHHVRSCLAGPVMAADAIVWDAPDHSAAR